ncbi:MAG: oligosaccharide flippase family protein [Clostridiaceae bacterium]|nr:oligosaccharide flippase family protein [Clostridiaceae bacterium]
MKAKLKKVSKKPFIRNVAIVATGTAAAQIITMGFSPFITRIYGPEAFGVLGVFLSVIGVISPIAALSYPIAIVLPKNDEDAKGLVRISLYVAGVIATVVGLFLLLVNEQIVGLLQIETIASFVYLIPLVIMFSAVLQVAQQWLIRKKQFKVKARVASLQALILNGSKVGFGLFYPFATVLIILSVFGQALQSFMLIIGLIKSDAKEVTDTNSTPLKELAKQHRDFPLYRAPQVFLNAVSQSLPVLMLTSLFGPASAGFYSLGRRVLSMPTQLIGNSVGDVFYPRIAEAANNGENLTRMIIKATLALAAVGIIPFGIVMAFGPWLFEFVFGADWVVAGEYARWIALWTLCAFINRPSVRAIPVLNLQDWFLVYEIISLAARVGALLLGFYLFRSDISAIILFSLSGVVLNAFLIFYTIKKSISFYTRRATNNE